MTNNCVKILCDGVEKLIPVSQELWLQAKKNGAYVIELYGSQNKKMFMLIEKNESIKNVLNPSMLYEIEEFL